MKEYGAPFMFPMKLYEMNGFMEAFLPHIMTPKLELSDCTDDEVDETTELGDEEERGGITDVHIFTRNIAVRARRNGIIVRYFVNYY